MENRSIQIPSPQLQRTGGNIPAPAGLGSEPFIDSAPYLVLPAERPNTITLAAGAWVELPYVHRPMILRALAVPNGPIIVCPGSVPPAEDTGFQQTYRSGLDTYIPLPGKWWARNTGTVGVLVQMLDAMQHNEQGVYRRFGFTRWTQAQVVLVVANVPLLVAAANPNRRLLRIAGGPIAGTVYLGPTNAVIPTTVGWCILAGTAAQGAPTTSFESSESSPMGLYLGEVWAVSTTALTSVNIQEGE